MDKHLDMHNAILMCFALSGASYMKWSSILLQINSSNSACACCWHQWLLQMAQMQDCILSNTLCNLLNQQVLLRYHLDMLVIQVHAPGFMCHMHGACYHHHMCCETSATVCAHHSGLTNHAVNITSKLGPQMDAEGLHCNWPV